MALVIFLAVFADWLPFVHSYSAGSVLDGKSRPRSPLDGHRRQRRDIFSRWVYGAGVAHDRLGGDRVRAADRRLPRLLAGYHRKRTDTLIVTVMDILLAFPALVLALMLVTFGQAPDGGDRHISWGRSTSP
jgi:peptide/nickel transport system permease protein